MTFKSEELLRVVAMSSSLLKRQWLQILTDLQPAVIKWEQRKWVRTPSVPEKIKSFFSGD